MLKLHLSQEEKHIFASNLLADKKMKTIDQEEKGFFGNFIDNAKEIFL
ncbi:PREDICTED: uncharacterized protein LOC109132563 [Camelina sativa]|uniref:Uncharacterized protein LOC109132563 n=1 Tax=Camelina sativa TaxID=90675 RepID=A0ABM1RLB6_CAMSA|nr:PREDICTED: uncharacterized protein LOC109132563 [Camelina sativa]